VWNLDSGHLAGILSSEQYGKRSGLKRTAGSMMTASSDLTDDDDKNGGDSALSTVGNATGNHGGSSRRPTFLLGNNLFQKVDYFFQTTEVEIGELFASVSMLDYDVEWEVNLVDANQIIHRQETKDLVSSIIKDLAKWKATATNQGPVEQFKQQASKIAKDEPVVAPNLRSVQDLISVRHQVVNPNYRSRSRIIIESGQGDSNDTLSPVARSSTAMSLESNHSDNGDDDGGKPTLYSGNHYLLSQLKPRKIPDIQELSDDEILQHMSTHSHLRKQGEIDLSLLLPPDSRKLEQAFSVSSTRAAQSQGCYTSQESRVLSLLSSELKHVYEQRHPNTIPCKLELPLSRQKLPTSASAPSLSPTRTLSTAAKARLYGGHPRAMDVPLGSIMKRSINGLTMQKLELFEDRLVQQMANCHPPGLQRRSETLDAVAAPQSKFGAAAASFGSALDLPSTDDLKRKNAASLRVEQKVSMLMGEERQKVAKRARNKRKLKMGVRNIIKLSEWKAGYKQRSTQRYGMEEVQKETKK
jgi:hypothetical protein